MIVNQDCLEFMATVLVGSDIDLTVTSPPYDSMRKYQGYSLNLEKVARSLFRVTSEGGVVVWVVGDETIKGSESGTSFQTALLFKEVGFNLHDTMIYQKNGTGACGSVLGYWQTFEYMFVFSKGKPKTFNPLSTGKLVSKGGTRHHPTKDGKTEDRPGGWRDETRPSRRGNIWLYNVGMNSGDDTLAKKHPARFPEKLAEDHILSWSNPGDIVFDPFLGSGTTAKMAIKNNRRFMGCDLSKEYCELARQRVALVSPT